MERVSCLWHLGTFLGYFDSQALRLTSKRNLQQVAISEFTWQELYRDYLARFMPNATPMFMNARSTRDFQVVIHVTMRDALSRSFEVKTFRVSQYRLIVDDRNWVPISLPLTKRAFIDWMNRAIRGRSDYRVSFDREPARFTTKEAIDANTLAVWD